MDNGMSVVLRVKSEMGYPEQYGGAFMKKVLVGTLAAMMVLSAGTANASAAGPGSGCGRSFVDTDGGGICDFAGEFCRYTDADRDGLCDYCGAGKSADGSCFEDLNGDGICDNAPGQGRHLGRGFRGGRNR